MRICFIADARSPIAQNWIDYFARRGDQIQVISTRPVPANIMAGVSIQSIPLGFSALNRTGGVTPAVVETSLPKSRPPTLLRKVWGQNLSLLNRYLRTHNLPSSIRAWTVPVQTPIVARRVRTLIEAFQPDFVHAMRIPYEGMLAADSVSEDIPLIISVWGNDFTLFANHFPLVARRTRYVMRRTDGLHTDCQRDLRLGHEWGFDSNNPSIVLPGAGGIDTNVFFPYENISQLRSELELPQEKIIILNARGFRSYVHNDVFFEAIQQVSAARPNILFIGLGMRGNPVAENSVEKLGIRQMVRLLPSVKHSEMAKLFQVSDINVSLSSHDGTPNTLLEAMACGSFPLAGDIESIREWIVDGKNGILCNPKDVNSATTALIQAIDHVELRRQARVINLQLIQERASSHSVMQQAERFYESVLAAWRK